MQTYTYSDIFGPMTQNPDALLEPHVTHTPVAAHFPQAPYSLSAVHDGVMDPGLGALLGPSFPAPPYRPGVPLDLRLDCSAPYIYLPCGGPYDVSSASSASISPSVPESIDPQFLASSASAFVSQTSTSPSYGSRMSASTTRFDSRGPCFQSSTPSSEERASPIEPPVRPSKPHKQLDTTIKAGHHSRQGKTGKSIAIKSKVRQVPRRAVLDALRRRPLRERAASADPLWDGKLICELCEKAYEAKSLQRHLESHGRQSLRSTWVCCGLPDGRNGREHGCGYKFHHRRDALVRHLKKTRCLGDLEEIKRHIREAREEGREVYPGVL
ncbi:unnamed protein product [Peniophora sp. CBMAI 1063]|nr:unnamed protein product [Peniophora sp. CBMAI 1063]